MRKILMFLSAIILLAGCNDELIERIEALENVSYDLSGQTGALEKSINSLESVYAEIVVSIDELSKEGKTQADMISKLEEYDKTLKKGIDELKAQLGKDISDVNKWGEETFVTLDVYDTLVSALDEVKELAGGNHDTLDAKIDKSVSDIKTWTNEALKAYYNSEQADAKLDQLKNKLTTLENKLDDLLNTFKITFDDFDIGITPGGTAMVNYTIKGATISTVVKATGQGGWTARVHQISDDKGSIAVTAPDPLVEDEIIVIVYDGEYRTIISSINFVTGVIVPSVETMSVPMEGGQCEASVTTNLDYTVSVPESDKCWISLAPQTKSMRTDVLTFIVSPNQQDSRTSTISLKTASGNIVKSIQIVQEGKFKPIEEFTVKDVSFKMIKVDGGTFTMGATPEQGSAAESKEKPTHLVTLSDYYIGQTVVTQKLWEAVMGSNPSYHYGIDNPVEQISWNDIVNDFLPKLNALTGNTFILPTEAQWEFAARGGNESKGYKYSGSDIIDDIAWYHDNSSYETYPVGQKLPNELGLYDMSGNVWEWCNDWYGVYSAEAQTDPKGPSTGSDRVLRGGSFIDIAGECRVSLRSCSRPDYMGDCGFRLALSLY